MTIVGKLSRFVDELERPEELLGDNGSAAKLGCMMARWAKLNLNGRYALQMILLKLQAIVYPKYTWPILASFKLIRFL